MSAVPDKSIERGVFLMSMTIEKAIEILEIAEASDFAGITYDFEDAVLLGIEALKRVLDVRRFPEASNWRPLPGETEGVNHEHQ